MAVVERAGRVGWVMHVWVGCKKYGVQRFVAVERADGRNHQNLQQDLV